MDTYLLVDFSYIVSSEDPDVEGFLIIRKNEWEDYINLVKKTVNFPFVESDNELWRFESLENYLGCIEAQEITEDKAEVLLEFFPYGYGTFYLFRAYDELEKKAEKPEELDTLKGLCLSFSLF